MQPLPGELGDVLHRVPDDLGILARHPQSSNTPDMPVRFLREVLNHDTREHDYFRIQIVQHLTVAQIQTVRDILADPLKVLVVLEEAERAVRVARVDLAHPVHAPLEIGLVALPSFPRGRALVLVLVLLVLVDGHNSLEGLADPHDADGLDEDFPDPTDELPPLLRRREGVLGDEMQVELAVELRVVGADEGGGGEEVPSAIGIQIVRLRESFLDGVE